MYIFIYIFDQFKLSFAHETYTIKIMKVGKENMNKGARHAGKRAFEYFVFSRTSFNASLNSSSQLAKWLLS